MEKPRIFKKYYPSLKKGFWRVSCMPKPYTNKENELWGKAHTFVGILNLYGRIKW